MAKIVKHLDSINRKKERPTAARRSISRLPKRSRTGIVCGKFLALKYICVIVFAIYFAFNGFTSAYFTSTVVSSSNFFQAGNLDFGLASTSDFSPVGIRPGQKAEREVVVEQVGSLGFKYSIEPKDIYGELCDVLEFKAFLNGTEEYAGLISGFTVSEKTYVESDTWLFQASLPGDSDQSLALKNCGFKLRFFGWQENLSQAEGFTHEELLSNSITSGDWQSGIVINESMVRPSKNGSMPEGEWIELYNLSETQTVDVGGWILRDSRDDESHAILIESCRTDTGGTAINGNEFLVVYLKGGKGCGSEGLQFNPKDVIRLYDGDGQMVDSFEYDSNTDKGTTYSRVPDGTGEWVVQDPTAGESNVLNALRLAPLAQGTSVLPDPVQNGNPDTQDQILVPELSVDEAILAPELVEGGTFEGTDPSTTLRDQLPAEFEPVVPDESIVQESGI